jgi:hypothetical protein
MADVTELIPMFVSRRLLLALLGFRQTDGLWCRDDEVLTDEQLDCLDDAGWQTCLERWDVSAMSVD